MHSDDPQKGHNYPGSKGEFTEKLNFLTPTEYNGIPVYRVLNQEGQVTRVLLLKRTKEVEIFIV